MQEHPRTRGIGGPAQVTFQGGELGQARTGVVAQLAGSLWGCLPEGESPIKPCPRSRVGDLCR